MTQLGGLVPPVIAPLTPGGEVDRAVVVALTDRLIDAGVDGLFVLGSCGQGPTLSDAQRRSVVDAYEDAIADRVPLFVGIPDPSPERARDTLSALTASRIRAVVVGAPYYYIGAPADHVTRHVLSSIEDYDGDVILYNIPQATGNAFSPEQLERLAEDPRVVGLKDSCADAERSRELQLVASGAGLAFFQGAEALLAEALARGADGIIPGIANAFPIDCRRLLDAAANGRPTDRLQARIVQQCDATYGAGHWLAALHAAVAREVPFDTGLSGGIPPLSREQFELQTAALDRIPELADAR